MKISMIVAASTNGVIGMDGGLPWHLPEDLRRFRELTMGKPIIMGRTTHESIGRVLPGRTNIVLTSNPNYNAPGCEVATRLDQALAFAGEADEVMIIGGAYVYQSFLPMTERIYLTRVRANIDGDAYFPELDPDEWTVRSKQEFPVTDDRDYGFSFQILERS
ncbi:MAG: dihydrofolate reductase [Gammaproteobacteria bacterium]|nr:dihydrofolate reductase [Gammaproteobacteria bacterium]